MTDKAESIVGKTILHQIEKGVLMSLGARDLVFLEKGLQFKVSNLTRRIVQVTLSPLDLYDVVCKQMQSDWTWLIEYESSGVYAENLSEVLLFVEKSVWGK